MNKFVFSVLVVFASLANAGNVEMGSDGSLRSSQVMYKPLDITVSAEALKYNGYWQKAIKEPGVVVPVHISERNEERTNLFHQKVSTIVDTGLVFDENAKTVDQARDVVVKSEILFDPYLAVLPIVLFALLATNVMFLKGKDGKTGLIVSVILFVWLIAFSAAGYTRSLAFAFIFCAALMHLVTFVHIHECWQERRKTYWSLTSIQYLWVGASVFARFF